MRVEPAMVLRVLEKHASRGLDDEVDRTAVSIAVADAVGSMPDVTHAQRDAALDSLERLVRYVQRIGGFMSAEDQQMLRGAKALLAEMGRKL